MKNEEKVAKIIEKWLHKHEFTELTISVGNAFMFYNSNNHIDIAFEIPTLADKCFMAFAHQKGLRVDCGDFILALFHEIGHYLTLDSYPDLLYVEDEDEKNFIQCALEGASAERQWELNMQYYNLGVEKVATLWAIGYINEHATELKGLAQQIQKYFPNKYKY